VLLAAPIIIAFATAVLCFIFRARSVHRLISFMGAVALLGAGLNLFVTVDHHGPQAAQMGGWPAPFGITLAADLFSAAMVVIVGLSGLAVIWYSLSEASPEVERKGYHALSHAMMAGVSGAFLTGDLFNLYVWFEVMLISSFGLLVIGGRARQIDGAVKYVALNLVGTIAFLTGVGLLYGTTGTVNMADLSHQVAGRTGETAVLGSAALLLFAFAAKAALFPVFFWLPAAYHTPAIGTSALFSALLTKVGVYSLIRVFTLIFGLDAPGVQGVLLTGAALTIALGALGAVSMTEIRRVYGFHIVSQIGMMTVGLALGTKLALAGAVFYFFHHIPAKMNMFLLGGVISRECGSERLDRIGGMWTAAPWLGVLFLIPALSLIGVPPLSGTTPIFANPGISTAPSAISRMSQPSARSSP